MTTQEPKPTPNRPLPKKAFEPFNPYLVFVFAPLPNAILSSKMLGLGAKVTYAVLCQFSGPDGLCFPSQAAIAARIGLSTRQVNRYIKELCHNKYILIHRRGLTKTNYYSFLWRPEWSDTATLDTTNPTLHNNPYTTHHIKRIKLKESPPISPPFPKRGDLPSHSNKNRRQRTPYSPSEPHQPTPEENTARAAAALIFDSKIKPAILKDQIKKPESDLSFDELTTLHDTKRIFINKYLKDLKFKPIPLSNNLF